MLFIAQIHALADSRHYRGGQVEGCIQHVFGNSVFPGVRQATVNSRLAVPNDRYRNADQVFFPFGQKIHFVCFVIVFSKVRSFGHGLFPCDTWLKFTVCFYDTPAGHFSGCDTADPQDPSTAERNLLALFLAGVSVL